MINNNLETKKKILVVEDEEAYLKVLHDQLVKSGYEVLEAIDGEEGLKVALAEKPDLILLDIIIPKIDGLQMLEKLREDSWGSQVQVFILTNVNESKDISEGINNSISRYFVKSDINLKDLMWSIKVCLK